MTKTTQSSLPLGDAVAAILVLDNGRYLLQLRDNSPGIWYPGCWGLFGGGIDHGEDEIAALRRELREEINFDLDEGRAKLFTRFEFDLRPAGDKRYFRAYYAVSVTLAAVPHLTLHEGADMRAFSGDEALGLRLSPYDGFALFLFHQHLEHGLAFPCGDKPRR